MSSSKTIMVKAFGSLTTQYFKKNKLKKFQLENCNFDEPVSGYEKFKARLRASFRHLCIQETKRSQKEKIVGANGKRSEEAD